MDRQVFGGYLVDGFLNVPERLTIYVSNKDKALGMSRFVFSRDRLGQMWADGQVHPTVRAEIARYDNISFINVTPAEGSTSDNGHAYFRQSPWASSDILMTLMYGLQPNERGLIRGEDSPIWTFPPDYIERLRTAIATNNPEFQTKMTNE